MHYLAAAHTARGGIFLLFELAFLVAAIVAAAKILSKAGYSPWFSLLLLIPVVNFVMLLVFAFSKWPVDQELERYRQGGYGPGPGGYQATQWPPPPPGYGPGQPTPPPGYGSGPTQYPGAGSTPPPGGSTPPPGGSTPPPPGG